MPKFKHAVVITGSIGSGKSAVCELLRDRGFEIIDADKISHCVIDRCAAQVAEIFGAQYIVQKDAQTENLSSHAGFSDERYVDLTPGSKFKDETVLIGDSSANDGKNSIDTTHADLKFDARHGEEILPGSRASVDRKKLGELVFKNPAELAKLEALLHPKITAEILSQARALEAKGKLFFVDIPLFFEGKRYEFFDKVAVVYAPKDTLIARVMKRNGLDHAAAKHRVELQMDIEQKRAMADFVIDNSGDFAALKVAVERFLKELKDKI
ncbi:dephospho-CoA kinase [uncultured Campylobacter sp.]|uniref:dephospho-CoA kinase n=1 Tax=uncultured Campylobacter sp. TaxID=218934 RepID=UPI0026207C59|nr:dephospho-CoA kinase [uncultured Campylobacter sp.]